MVSMQDIADRLGVSRSTVSLVLSGKAGSKVSEAVKKKVLETAREMNYHINSLARSLRTGESQLISVIVADISNEFFGRLTSCIQEEAKKAGYLVLTINSNESASEFDEMAGVVIGKKVDGIIAVPAPDGEAGVARIQRLGVPLVTVDRLFEDLPVSYVGVDNYGSSLDLMHRLLADGYRKVSLMGLDLGVPPLLQRRAAYIDAMNEAGLSSFIDIRLIPFLENEEEQIGQALQNLHDSEAIFFTSRRIFALAMSHIARGGLKVPPTECFACFDDVSSFLAPCSDFRCIGQPVEEMAREAFQLLIRQIKGDRAPVRRIFPANYLRIR